MLIELQKEYEEYLSLDLLGKKHPKYAKMFLKQGINYFIQNEYIKAAKAFNEALEIDAQLGEACYYKGLSYIKMIPFKVKNLELYLKLAIKDFEKAIELGFINPELFFELGLAKMDSENPPEEIISAFSKAIELKPDYCDAYAYRGYIKSKIDGEYENAIADFEIAINKSPKTKYFELLSIVKWQNGDIKGAIRASTEAIDILSRSNIQNFLNRSMFYSQLNEYENAVNDISNAINIGPNREDLHNDLSKLKSTQQKYFEASAKKNH